MSEYIKDKLNQQIRELMRENSMLKQTMFRMHQEQMDLQLRFNDVHRRNNALGNALGAALAVTLAVLIWMAIIAMRY